VHFGDKDHKPLYSANGFSTGGDRCVWQKPKSSPFVYAWAKHVAQKRLIKC